MGSDEAREQFRAKFRLGELTLHTGRHWVVSVRPAQPVPGSVVVSTTHGALSFAEAPPASGEELLELLGAIETTARSDLGAARINVLCLMMVDPLLHFHVLPRFQHPVELGGRTWTDTGWPGPPELAAEPAGDAELRAVADVYRRSFPSR